ncbi:MAG: DUF2336 domain-containing protein, partial [Pseudolabrys sp.]
MAQSSATSPLDSLVDLACRDGVDIRPTLLRVITDLYVQKPAHTDEEETQYVELALGLIGAVGEGTRTAVAARLGSYANAPRAVLDRLAGAPAEAAASPRPQPPTASKPAATKPATPEPLVEASLQAAPEPASTSVPMDPAEMDPAEMGPAEMGPAAQELIEVFFTASSEERRLILINLDVAAAPAPQRQTQPVEAVIRRLESTALQRNVSEFVRMLERGLGVSRQVATRIAHDPSGEGIVVAAKALDMKADVLQRILLFLNPAIGQSVARVFELAQLYEEITPGAAAHLVSIWRQSAERLRPRHAPMLYADDR